MVTWATPQRQVFINGLVPGNFFEAPWLFKRDGLYYLSFMEDYAFGASVGAPFGWSLGYAINNSTDPLANYTYMGPLMWANPLNCGDNANCADSLGSVGGNSHHGFVLDWPVGSGQAWLAYHTRNLVALKDQNTFSQRNVGLDRVYFEADGKITTPVTSTPNWVRQVKAVDAYAAQPAVAFAAGSSLFLGSQPALAADPAGGMYRFLWNVTDGSYIRVAGVDFGAAPGASGFTVRVASATAGGAVEARLDGPGGQLVAVVAVPSTGGWGAFANVSTSVIGSGAGAASGLRDLWLVFRAPPPGANASTMIFNVASWAFSGGVAAGAVPPAPAVRVALRSRITGARVTAPTDGTSPLTAGAGLVGPPQTFGVVDNGDGSYSLRCANGRFVAAASPGGALAASAASPSEPLAQWRLAGTPDGAYALVAAAGAAKGQMVVAGPGAGDALTASGKDAGSQGGAALFDLEPIV